ncbi:unnamed protein product [Brachionus calyciflorus]|uniref:Uncharacterized protein n=1 Tax=Brachionus calyciflorus TaxID=104777 RepID=A0A813M1X6_9BILA|nr:unnamed protein product [Brachionus calyciflorus]
MGNSLKASSKSPSLNCFSKKLPRNKTQMNKSFSYDSSTKLNLIAKVKNRIKNTHMRRVPKSKTDENFLVIDEIQNEHDIIHDKIDEEVENQIMEELYDKPLSKFKKSPALYNIQSIEDDNIKISDLVSNSISFSYENEFENLSETSFSNSTLSLETDSSKNPSERFEQVSDYLNEESRFSSNLIKHLLLKTLRCQKSTIEQQDIQNEEINDHEEVFENDGLKFIDESMSCNLNETSSSSISLTNSYSTTKSQTNLSFKILNDVNRKLNRIQHLKKKRTIKNERENLQYNSCYLHELNQTRCDLVKDNISVYTLFNTLNKQAPFASSESISISASNIYLDKNQDYFLNSANFSFYNSITNLNN